MRLVFLIPSLRAGGAERVFANLLSLWDLERDEVHLVLLKREGPLLATLPARVIVHELGTARFLQAIPRLVKLVRTLSPDALLSTHAHMNAAVGLLRPWLRIPRVVGRETNMPRQVETASGSSFLRRGLYGWGYRRLDAVVCLSDAMAQEVQDQYGVTKAVVIPNPLRVREVREAAAQALPSEFAAMAEGRWLAAVGRFSDQKGFDLLIRAMAELPPDIRLCLIGDGPLRSSLEAQAQTHAAGRVLFAGYQENPHRLVARSRLFVLSSRYEGQPNAALEALVQGIPVAAFDGPWGAKEVVVAGTTGTLARAFDSSDLARAIQKALAAPWERSVIQKWAEERFEGTRVAGLYRGVLS